VPTPTYIPLATLTLTATDSEIVFSSIPATYRDLILVFQGRTSGGGNLHARFNSDSGSNYSVVRAGGNGSTTVSSTSSFTNAEFSMTVQMDSTTLTQNITQIMDYSATDKQKTYLTRMDRANAGTEMLAGRWANTASAINQIQIFTSNSSTFSVGSTFSLFGVN
jgi:hypothetical protein